MNRVSLVRRKNVPVFSRLLASGALALLAAAFAVSLRADIVLPSLLSTHAVLQKSAATRIWGKADPGEKVHITLGSVQADTEAGADGRWQATVNLLKSDAGPFDLVVTGKNTLTVADVMVGEDWLCAGQSNMQWSLRGDAKEMTWLLTSKHTNPMLRQFQVAIDTAADPRDDCKGAWTVATPQDAPAFTGVGYFFGKKLQTELQVPVGLIHSSVGGTPIEQFMSLEAFEKLPSLNAGRLARLKTFDAFPGRLQEFVTAYNAWTAKYDRQDKIADPALFAGPDIPVTDWSPMPIPGKAASPGTLWVRHTVEAAGLAVGHPATLTLGGLHDFVSIYWNGALITQTDPAHPPIAGIYKFTIPGEQVRAGTNVLALRLVSAADPPGLYDHGVSLGLGGQGSPVKWEGDWLAKMENTLPPVTDQARHEFPKAPFPPSISLACSVYNAMIAPLLPFTLRGITWYQGEANVPRAQQYKSCFQAMIEDYRQKWGSELPFYFCQLPNYLPAPNDYSRGRWAELREAQAAALALPETGQAVLIDVGEEGNLHPFDKRDPGERLALIALANTYGKAVAYSGPVFHSLTVDGSRARVKFTHLDGGLVARPVPEGYKPNTNAPVVKPLVRTSPQSQLEGFAVCGEDGKWVWADASIVGDTVVVSAPAVSRPVAVRYDWSDSPWGNLYNGAGLPASPFRTDTQPELSANNKY